MFLAFAIFCLFCLHFISYFIFRFGMVPTLDVGVDLLSGVEGLPRSAGDEIVAFPLAVPPLSSILTREEMK